MKPIKQRTAAKTRRVERKPKTQTERRAEAMTQILDAAEKLFAQHGRSDVTLRALAEEAAVDPALVRYYFDDLDGVFHETVQRKSDIVNALRNKAMDDYLAEHGSAPTTEGAFDAYLRPVFETIWNDPKKWTNFVAIIAQANSSPFQGRDVMRNAFDTYVLRFVDLLRRAAPEVPMKDIFWLHQLMSGSMLLTLAQTGRIDILSDGLCDSADMKSAYDAHKSAYCAAFDALRARYAGKRKDSAVRTPRRK